MPRNDSTKSAITSGWFVMYHHVTLRPLHEQHRRRWYNENMEKTEEEWKKELTPEEYRVLREGGTEAPFKGAFVENHETGMYTCKACGIALFSSDAKFDSKSGWPSFTDPAVAANV